MNNTKGLKTKISIIGAGNIGGTAALLLLQKNIAEIVLLDVLEGLPQGKALDLRQGSSIQGYSAKIKGTNDFQDIADSDIVFITAGLARKPGMDRLDLLKKNALIIETIVKKITEYSPNTILILMTNPVDVLTYHAWKLSGFPAQKVIGQAGMLDTARFTYFLSSELAISAKDIDTIVLGGHGDTMVPLPRLTKVQGKPLTELLSGEKITKLIERTRQGGAEIVSLLKTSSAYYAPAAAAVAMMEAIIKDSKNIFPVSAYLNGEYGIQDVCVGVPAILGEKGVEKILELDLTKEELQSLRQSALIYKKSIAELSK